ncbi:CRISPR-associated protein, Cmr3 family [Sulfolobus islandicus Y.G.57.14]|uniref:CRISPR-associated protein, Cmr3 family n=1 Tax=Saccharolobus islandicus (strain Y.G.57.14 / Yellowstone \|nr:type III-B CRISPR module-associated protein Cmr3 [Sulfolobus islandicus]ACP44903.1 CRISPR-associated protein, Cmr3 family [Sulfolobus islandicus Y.G.57.14]
MKRVLIKPLEPLMFRSQGEFEPLITGSHTAAQSLIIPRPSTIAGMLGYILFNKSSGTGDWLSDLTNLLDTIYGTFIETNGEYLFPLRMGNHLALVDQQHLINLPILLEKEYEQREKGIYELFYDKNKLFQIINHQDRIGISIDKSTRTVKEHYLYSARYLAFKKEVNYVIFIDNDAISDKINGKIVNFGGENRIAKLEVDDYKVDTSIEEEYYLTLSPILIPDEALDDLLDNISDYVTMGKVDKISLGFDIANTKRKEMLTAILEGSIVKRSIIDFIKKEINNNLLDRFTKYEKIGYNTLMNLYKLAFRKILS